MTSRAVKFTVKIEESKEKMADKVKNRRTICGLVVTSKGQKALRKNKEENKKKGTLVM